MVYGLEAWLMETEVPENALYSPCDLHELFQILQTVFAFVTVSVSAFPRQ